jgi:hypothetical protein
VVDPTPVPTEPVERAFGEEPVEPVSPVTEVPSKLPAGWRSPGKMGDFMMKIAVFLMEMSYVFFLPDHCFAMRKSFAEPRLQGFLGGVLRGL